MSRELRFRSDFWRALHPLPTRLRLLYSVLCFMADHAGVVVWNPAQIAEECGGKGFGFGDVEGLGERVMWLDEVGAADGARLLIVDWLAMQNKSLSRASRGQVPVWRAISKHWPGENGLIEGWRALGILQKLPPIIDEHHGEEHTGGAKPAWRRELEKHVEDARAVPLPHGVNGEMGEVLKRFFGFRERWALDALSKTDAQKRDWQPIHVREITRMVLGWPQRGHSMEAISDAISRAIAGSFTAPLEPMSRKK